MNPGELRHQLELQENRRAPNPAGERVDSWATIETLWGKVDPLHPREYERAKSFAATVSHKITIRYRAGVTSKHRLLFESRIFLINGCLNREERNYALDIFVTEYLP